MAEFIEKQEALDGMRQLPHEYKTKEQRARTGGIAACQMVVKNIEPADVRPVVRGHDTGKCGIFQCSVCGYGVNDIYEAGSCGRGMPMLYELQREWNFCPNCGADMREA